jgi:hypothetical protein
MLKKYSLVEAIILMGIFTMAAVAAWFMWNKPKQVFAQLPPMVGDAAVVEAKEVRILDGTGKAVIVLLAEPKPTLRVTSPRGKVYDLDLSDLAGKLPKWLDEGR